MFAWRWFHLKTAVGSDDKFAITPQDGFAEEAETPGDEAGHIFHGQEPPPAFQQRVFEDGEGGRPGDSRAEHQSQDHEAQGFWGYGPHQEGNGERFREYFADVTRAARTPGAAGPAQAVFPVLQKRVVPDVVLNDMARENNAAAFGVETVADDEVFGEVPLHHLQAADGREVSLAGGERAADGEVHAVQETLGQHTCEEVGVEAEGFEAGPEARTSDGAIGARDERNVWLLQFGDDGGETVGVMPDVTVGHNQVFIRRLGQQGAQTPDLGIGEGRRPRDNKARGNAGEVRHDAACDFGGRVFGSMDREQDFKSRVLLAEEATKVFLGVIGRAGEGPQDRNRRIEKTLLCTAASVTPCAQHGQNTVDQRACQQGQEDAGKDTCKV